MRTMPILYLSVSLARLWGFVSLWLGAGIGAKGDKHYVAELQGERGVAESTLLIGS